MTLTARECLVRFKGNVVDFGVCLKRGDYCVYDQVNDIAWSPPANSLAEAVKAAQQRKDEGERTWAYVKEVATGKEVRLK